MEVYEKLINNNFKLRHVYKLGNNIQNIITVTYADLDHSGAVDIIFFFKSNNKFFLKALLNSEIPAQICQFSENNIFPYSDFDLGNLI